MLQSSKYVFERGLPDSSNLIIKSSGPTLLSYEYL